MAMIPTGSRFSFLFVTDAQYASIAEKNPITFYITNEGKGWLGSFPLFDGHAANLEIVKTELQKADLKQNILYLMNNSSYNDGTEVRTGLSGLYLYDGTALISYSDNVIAAYLAKIMVNNMTTEGYLGDANTIPTTKAVIDAIDNKLAGEGILSAKFFRTVTSHTLTQADIDNTAISCPADSKVGDVGLMFTSDNDMADGGESFYFVCLNNYITIYTFENSSSVNLTAVDGFKVNAAVRINEDEKSVSINAVEGKEGLTLKKTVLAVNDVTPDADTLVTEDVLVTYIEEQVLTAIEKGIKDALADVVTYQTYENATAPVT